MTLLSSLILFIIGITAMSCSDVSGAAEDEENDISNYSSTVSELSTPSLLKNELDVKDSTIIDTVRIIDTLIIKDSLIIKDTLIVKDSLVVKDTIVIKDSLIIKDTVFSPVDIDAIIDSLNNAVSPFYKDKNYGAVPTVRYDGLLQDYSWGGEFTGYEEIIQKFDELLIPNYSTKESIGFSSDNREMFVYKFTPVLPEIKIVGQNKYLTRKIPTIMIVCGQHGYEKGSIFGTWHLLKDIITNSGNNEFLRYLRKNVNIYVVAAANPWGLDHGEYLNANGVNLNRNWDVDGWIYNDGVKDPSQASGLTPFDQPETAAIRDFVLAHKDDIDLFIDHHTNGGAININSETKSKGIQELNWIDLTLYAEGKDPYFDRMSEICFEHSLNINSLFREVFPDSLLGITGAEGEETRVSHITYESPFPRKGYSDTWAITQNILAICLEGFNGFPTGEVYGDDVKRGMSILLGNFIQTTLQILSE